MERFRLTDRGHQALALGTRLSEPRKVLEDLNTPEAEMSHWQLVYALERDGWEMRGIDSKESLRHARQKPYDPSIPDSPK
eukprot:6022461-Lingulodinium_polyedra.AAC.1